LNKACSKDSYSLSKINKLVDSTAGYKFLNSLDAYFGYHQILMHPANKENTSFITERGAYCYRTMPFSLKNIEATYQRMVDKVFKNQSGRIMEGYVYDMLVKSMTFKQYLQELR